MAEKPKAIDREAVRQACLDYAEGFFEGDADRLRSALHPDLVKRTAEDGRLGALDREELIAIATGEERETPAISVRVVDVDGDMATATIHSEYVDYVHLARIDGDWRIVNVLWG